MKSFHPSMTFDEPQLPHMGLDFGDFRVIGFILASSTQQKA
jgi:hypothetical protein